MALVADTITICLAVASLIVDLGVADIELRWTHSVQRTSWAEGWRAGDGGLIPLWARVEGSGAGMEPGEGAVRTGNGWEWRPAIGPLPTLDLARSDAIDDWRICRSGKCATVQELTGIGPGTAARLLPCPRIRG
jgi:hypothetical protein